MPGAFPQPRVAHGGGRPGLGAGASAVAPLVRAPLERGSEKAPALGMEVSR